MHTTQSLVRQVPARTWLLVALGLLLVLIAAGYIFDWPWTGFLRKSVFD
jgi:hypothetical protein